MKLFILFIAVVVAPALIASKPASQTTARFDGHKLLKILHNTENDLLKLLGMEVKYELDFWKLPRHVNDTTYVRVPPQHLGEFLNNLQDINAHVLTIIEDIQKLVEESPRKIKDFRRRSTFDLFNYHTYRSIQSYLRSISGSPRQGLTVEVFTIGASVENRNIDGVKISSSSGSNKRSIIIDGGIHAREWIAPAAVIYTIDQLVNNNPSNDFYQDVNWLLEHYDVYVIPVLNPDGYEFTDYNRMWRKNRQMNGNGCYGVDLNRNFPFHWDPATGGSSDPCSDLYSGSGPGSEPETQHMTSFLKSKGAETDAYLTVHSYGQMWLYPWGYTSALPSDWQDLEKVARNSINDVRALYGSDFITGSITRTLYAAAGGSDDYAKGVAGIKYSYTLELRDTGRYGFQLPKSLIRPSCEEFVAGVLAFAKNMYATENSAGK